MFIFMGIFGVSQVRVRWPFSIVVMFFSIGKSLCILLLQYMQGIIVMLYREREGRKRKDRKRKRDREVDLLGLCEAANQWLPR
jgi:hypothetical protein